MPQSIAPSTRPPPTSGGGIYIVLAVALLAAIVGLVYWKVKGGNETAAPVMTATPVVTNAAPLAEPPPPPPPVDEPVAAVDAGAARAPTTTTAYSPCGVARCGGTGSAALETAVSARAGSARPCYERALRVNSTLQGKLLVKVRVDPQGNVCSASIGQDDIHFPEVSNCVMGMFRSAKFPAPSGGCVEFNVPLNFTPKEGR